MMEFVIRGIPSPWANGEPEVRWRKAIATQVPPRPEIPAGAVFEVELEFCVHPDRLLRGNDLDNLAKPVLDTLFTQSRPSKHPTGALFGVDDGQVVDLKLRKTAAQEEGVRVAIRWR